MTTGRLTGVWKERGNDTLIKIQSVGARLNSEWS